MKKRPTTTLFMLMSLDGKISTGSSDLLDFDKDLPKIKGAKEGLHQYYELEKHTDIVSFNTGRVMAKIGVNQRKQKPKKIPVTFVIVDNKPHLNNNGLQYLSQWVKKVILVTNNKKLLELSKDFANIAPVRFSGKPDFKKIFAHLHDDFGIQRMTVQSGGTMNASLIRSGLIDRVSVVVAPIIVGGKNTSTIVDGESIKKISELRNIKALELQKVTKLKNSYLHLVYKVQKF